jgi:hypothetical protein
MFSLLIPLDKALRLENKVSRSWEIKIVVGNLEYTPFIFRTDIDLVIHS